MGNIDIELTRKEIQELLSIFASAEFQKREWEENREKTVVFPTELFSQWFDDIFDYPDDPRRIVERKILTADEWKIMEPFYAMLEKFTELYEKEGIDNRGKTSILAYTPWIKVRKKAKETLEKLDWAND